MRENFTMCSKTLNSIVSSGECAPANASADDHGIYSEHEHLVAIASRFEGGRSRMAPVDLSLDVTAKDGECWNQFAEARSSCIDL